MHRALPWLALVGCAPPPEIAVDDTDLVGPSIEILFPKDGDTFDFVAGCAFVDVPLVVLVEGVELAAPGEVVEGQGHWHGGPNLEAGYCVGIVPYCDGVFDRDPVLETASFEGLVDGPGTRKLTVELVDGLHQPLGSEDSIEVTLLDPTGACG